MFTWIPFYTELSKKLLEYKDNRTELVSFIYAEDGLSHYTNYLHTSDGKNIDDIDPFSFFGIFNTSNKRNAKLENRIDILTRIKHKFDIKADVPSDFEGVPVLYFAHSFYFDWNDVKNSCDLLWNAYVNLMDGNSVQEFFDFYKFTQRHSETTMPLYWIKPYEYISLDRRNRAYLLNQYGIETLETTTDFASYKAVSELVKEKISTNAIHEENFAELSRQAYMKHDEVQEDHNVNIWFVRDANENQFNHCFTKKSLFFNCDNKIDDMSELGDTLKSFSKALGEGKPFKKTTVLYSYWQLSHEVKKDDIIIYFKNREELYGWGQVIAAYNYDETKQFHHSVGVDWKKVSNITDSPVKHTSGLWFKDINYNEAKPLLNLLGITSEKSDKMKYQDYINLLKENHNLVLTGAPGTGKTFMAKAIAKEMGATTEFVQFHPSYDYTDFMEGLRPIEKGEDKVGFRRMDGIFKKFCKSAIINEATKNNDVLKKLNNDPKVWKVSLSGTYDNPIRTDCLANNYIRIGWCGYGDVEDFNEMQEFPDGGRSILRAFQSEMQIGDVVVSCYSQYETDAIGIITGDYEYRAEGNDYPRYRSVEWLIKGKNINIQDVIGKRMTLSTIYKQNVSVTEILGVIKKNGGLSTDSVKENKPYVMIIDEINRGEASKIFGELFYAIDPGYRGIDGRVKTQYQNLIEQGDVFYDGFYVPENVYILATMNDIDRSVESMDFAMRRRFTWKEITPNDTESMLDKLSCASEAKATMNRLNNVIADTEGLGSAYMVGPSYFLKLKSNGNDFSKLWEMNIEPLLKEYLRGFRKADEIMNRFHKAYCNTDSTIKTDSPILTDEE